MNFTQVMAALGLTTEQLLALMNNAQFPAANYDGNGIPTWSSGAISAFAALMSAAAPWQLDYNTQLASANWSALAATTPGPSYLPAGDALGDALDAP
ncbi:MAG: hypothetical protein ACLP19_05845 [Xanthobacteraceae bacterium]